tara:strand:+ start:831 stop:1034 length:204 start_codon:yes stop_codon:yes gene_type:complete
VSLYFGGAFFFECFLIKYIIFQRGTDHPELRYGAYLLPAPQAGMLQKPAAGLVLAAGFLFSPQNSET